MTKTKIEWADEVWNPVTGCTKVSQGCKNCYAEVIAQRFWGERKFTDVQLHPERLEDPLRWRKPRRVFVNSMSDLFHEDVPDEFIWKVFDVISHNRRHIYMILTKRPERMLKWFESNKERFWHYPVPGKDMQYVKAPWPDPCIWLGVSCENQKAADERIPLLLQTPAAVRFVSVEPMLGPVDIAKSIFGHGFIDAYPFPPLFSWLKGKDELNWVICGGESGPHARPIHPDWARSLRDQCQIAHVPFFFKQWGEWTAEYPSELSLANRAMTYEHGMTFYRVGKGKAGRVLDGRTWDEWPE